MAGSRHGDQRTAPCREAAAKEEAEAERERRALENNLRLQALREQWAATKAHVEVGVTAAAAAAWLALMFHAFLLETTGLFPALGCLICRRLGA